MYLLSLFLLSLLLQFSNSEYSSDEFIKYKKLQHINGNPLSSKSYPYVAAILKKYSYLCSGVLVSNLWVLSAGDPLFTIGESYRILRVRLGSTNYKKGGILTGIQYFEIHPNFDDSKPAFDLAMIRLAAPVETTRFVKPIRLLGSRVDTQHYGVTFWTPDPNPEDKHLPEKERLTRRRVLQVTHVHATEPLKCAKYVTELKIRDTGSLLCLDLPSSVVPSCTRIPGAAVVTNRNLWGIVSSWRPENCQKRTSPALVNLVTVPATARWIHSTIADNPWTTKNDTVKSVEEYSSGDDDEDSGANNI
ncbi:hypothetical protein JYU34_015457 [Plutella xylostella]|uniref:Peptidase S1 domain-containing protein n=1 Tax=Plutella xylostella TaxID=51655 RepID=A0ABQ7Q766_PLUXY|nr:hypothetical protein JYU34_015457 [Plutella xylostella]